MSGAFAYTQGCAVLDYAPATPPVQMFMDTHTHTHSKTGSAEVQCYTHVQLPLETQRGSQLHWVQDMNLMTI